MNCPHCQRRDTTYVIDSRPAAENITRRRYGCRSCHARFTSYELICPDVAQGKPAVGFIRQLRALMDHPGGRPPLVHITTAKGDVLTIYEEEPQEA